MTDRGRLLATVLLAAALLGSVLLPGPAAGGGLPPAPPAAPTFSPDPGVLLVRVCPHPARDDEFIELGNAGDVAIDLSGWSLTDREAIAVFPAATGLPPGGRLVATRNATSYAEDVRSPADLTYDRGDARRMEGDALRLADTGDEVLLLDAGGAVVDAYVYGTSSYAGSGWTGPPADAPARGEIATRLAHCLGDARSRGEIPPESEPDQLASLLVDCWEGAALRSRLRRDPAPLGAMLAFSRAAAASPGPVSARRA